MLDSERAIQNLKKIDIMLKDENITEKRFEALMNLKTTITHILDISLCNTIDEFIETPLEELEKKRENAIKRYEEKQK